MKTIATASFVLITLGLSGCVTTQDLRAKPALIDVSSAKASRAIAACITEKWEASGVFGMSMDVDNTVLADGYPCQSRMGRLFRCLRTSVTLAPARPPSSTSQALSPQPASLRAP